MAHLYFFSSTPTNAKKIQKSHQANAQGQCKLDTTDRWPKEAQQVTRVWQKWRFSASYDTFVGNQILALRINICDENRQLLLAAKGKHKKPHEWGFFDLLGRRRHTFPGITQVSSALRGLTSLFGMGRGGHPRHSHHKIFMFLWQILEIRLSKKE